MDKKGLIIIISGPSGVGKTTITHKILAEIRGIRQCITYTTRDKRPDEKDGIDYYFVDEAAFTRLINNKELAEWAIINGYRYGTPKSEIDSITSSGNDAVLVIDIQGAASIKALYPSALSIFIKPPSLEALKERLETRGEKDRVDMRLNRVKTEIEQSGSYDYILVNDTLDKVVDSLKEIIEKAKIF